MSTDPDRFRAAAGALAVDLVSAEVLARLHAAGIPALLLKGPVLATWLYSPAEVRPYGDVDLLVPPDAHAQAEHELHALGFVNRFGGFRDHEKGHAEEWHRASDGAEVDLHVTFTGLTARPAVVWSRLWRDHDVLDLARGRAQAPSQSARLLIVALHAIQHGPDHPGPTEDLRRALSAVDDAAWHKAAALADDLGGSEAFSAGLRLRPEGEALADRLGLAPPTSAAYLLMAQSMPREEREAALRWARLHEAGGVGAKAGFLLRRLRPSQTLLMIEGESPPATAYLRRMTGVARSLARGRSAWTAAARRTGEWIGPGARLEILAWSAASRAMIAGLGLNRTLAILDAVPRRRHRAPIRLPETGDVRAMGWCLQRAVARSQYLRLRGTPHQLVIGVAGPLADFRAHAWLSTDPAPPEYSVLHTVER